MSHLNKYKSFARREYGESSIQTKGKKDRLFPTINKLKFKLIILVLVSSFSLGFFMPDIKSSAASYSFTRDARHQMQGGTLRVSSGGVWRRNIYVWAEWNDGMDGVYTLVSNVQAGRTRKVCTTYIMNKTVVNRVTVKISANRKTIATSYVGRGVKAGTRRQLCSYERPLLPIGQKVSVHASARVGDTGADGNSIGVLSIYGLR